MDVFIAFILVGGMIVLVVRIGKAAFKRPFNGTETAGHQRDGTAPSSFSLTGSGSAKKESLSAQSATDTRRECPRTEKAKPIHISQPNSSSDPKTKFGVYLRPEAFSAETARPVQKNRILSGRAYVVDGDTLRIQKTQIRLFGIDAPEMNHPYGKTAKWALVKLCKGQTVHAEILEMDDHGRTVAKCCLSDGRDLSAEMVKAGLAIDWPKFSGGVYTRFEVPNARRKMWLADARQKGRMHVWEKFEARQNTRSD